MAAERAIEPLFATLAARGIDRVLPWLGDRPWNFVLHNGERLRIDLHLFEALPDGSLHYGSVAGGETFPACALDGRGTIAGLPVRCESPELGGALAYRLPAQTIRPSRRHPSL